MREGWREVRGGDWSQGGAGRAWNNGFDHFEIEISFQEKIKMFQPKKHQ